LIGGIVSLKLDGQKVVCQGFGSPAAAKGCRGVQRDDWQFATDHLRTVGNRLVAGERTERAHALQNGL
jgi:hypothetical protein